MQSSQSGARPGLVMLALAMGGFAIGVAEFATMSILPFFSADFGVSEAEAGHAISAYALGVCVGAPLVALLSARVPRRTLLVALMAYYAVVNGSSALMPGWGGFATSRFFAGLPHGAYFGVAGLMAASLVAREKRAQAVARVMLGLTVATVLGVPLANVFGAVLGWRWSFAIVTILAATCAIMVHLLAPRLPVAADASPMRELATLKRRQVWLTLAIGSIGSGGMFCIYTYLASVIMQHAGGSAAVVPIMLMVFGVGMTAGQFICGWAADKSIMGAAAGALAVNAVMMVAFWAVAGNLWLMAPVLLVIGITGGLSTILQTRLMDLASDAPTLSAALNHSAFNVANALGPWLGGLALMAGAGWPSIGLVGLGLSLAGLVIWGIAMLDDAPRRRGIPAG
ncbi:MFS transporter [Pseudooceanicola algae]|uniref:Inner membrane transport protein YdhP n=1 Tax=Pseudooceanicola algae TaxID=1537215 RepID=A0A418SKD8_9RHOB|nr:MFS transporter [Pseudooceanicola algae]QPM89081.1 Inner membrane transport protein YdhP [Pseudooceanicola algae]